MTQILNMILQGAGNNTLSRGHDYFLEKRIFNIRKQGDFIRGLAAGTRDYHFFINPVLNKHYCSCPAPMPCKHLVAAALTIKAMHPGWIEESPGAVSGKEYTAAFVFGKDTVRLMKIDPDTNKPVAAQNGDLLFTTDKNPIRYNPQALASFSPDVLETKDLQGFLLFSDSLEPLAYQGILRRQFSFVANPEMSGEYFLKPFLELHKGNKVISDNNNFPEYSEKLKSVFFFEIPNEDGSRNFYLIRNDFFSNYISRLSGNGQKSFSGIDMLSIEGVLENAGIPYPPDFKPVIFSEGPSLVLSLAPADHKKITATYEFVYARNEKYLPENNKEILSLKKAAKVLALIPANAPKSRSTSAYKKNDTGKIVMRNLFREKHSLAAIRKKDKPFKYSFSVSFNGLPEFVTSTIPALRKKNVIINIHSSLLRLVNHARNPKSIFDFDARSSGTDWFAGKLTIDGMSANEFSKAMKAYKKKESVIVLDDGSWISLELLGFNRLVSSFEEMGVKIHQDGTVKKLNRGQLFSIEYEANLRTDKALAGLKERVENLPALRKKQSAITFRSRFKGEFRPYQKEGIIFLESLYDLGIGGILADDMGLGKTIQGLGLIDRLNLGKKREHLVLIVGPLASIGVWKKEAEKFFPHLNVVIWHGLNRKNVPIPEKGIVLTTYGTLSRDFEEWDGKYKFDLVLLDEAQNLKNSKSISAHAVRKTATTVYFCLTGTPVENHLADLWSLMDLVFPGYLGTKKAFLKKWPDGADESLRKKITPFVLRRTKEKVIKELPPLTETSVPVAMTDRQRKLYEEARKQAIIELATSGKSYLTVLLPHLTKLRRISCHPEIGKGKKTDPKLSGKFQHLHDIMDEIVQSASGILVFSQFTDVLEICSKLLTDKGYDYHYLDGSTPLKKREKMVEAFQSGEKPFFLISLKAGGTALTLHRADTVIHLDPWWNPAAERQASDRAHRIGQKRKVMVYKLYSENSIEEKVIELQAKKKSMFATLFGENKGTTQITRDEIIQLLES